MGQGGCETCCLTLSEEHKLRVFENRVLRRIFGPKSKEMAGSRRRLHNEELCNLDASHNIIRMRMINSRRSRWLGHVAQMGVMNNGYKI
jgi:hypothetical protein